VKRRLEDPRLLESGLRRSPIPVMCGGDTEREEPGQRANKQTPNM